MSSNFKKHTIFYQVGWGFICAGIGVFIKTSFDAEDINNPKEFREIMQFVVGICGMLFALAALFFTLDNLSLQRITLEQQNKTIEQQNTAIELQKDELKIQNAEMKASNEYFKQQNETLKSQQADSTFFNMLNLHNEIVKNIDIRKVERQGISWKDASKPDKPEQHVMLYGRDCFKFFYSMFEKKYRASKERDELKKINEAQDELYESYQNDLGHYFRYLYTMIKFIDASEIMDKHQYTNIIRAQLSSHELLMLFYNCISDYGNEKFKPLIEKYHLLKNIPFNDLVGKDAHRALYNEIAFEKK